MERTIKFRAKSIIDGAWKYGMLAWCTPHNVVIRDENGQDWTCTPGTEGQYTGLEDSKGTEIYEGDIVRNGGFVCTVDYEAGAFHLVAIETSDEGCWDLLWEVSRHGRMGALEVIGNVHQNPDLLQP